MKIIVISIVIVAIIALVVGCTPSEPKPFPPPEGDIYIDGGVVVRGSGEPIELINNPDATDPTFAELVAFIERDHTDEYPYIVGPPKNAFICSDFAETVHNNAEAAGIRAAWVGIYIEGETEGHALNAFETTDLGLVFIDCTGKGLFDDNHPMLQHFGGDRRAHVEIGEPYALADMDTHASYFWFYITSGLKELTYPDLWNFNNNEDRMSLSEVESEWLQTHDIEALGQQWMQEWLQKQEAELSECGRVRGGAMKLYMLDCWEVPWFQPGQLIYKKEYIGGPNWYGFREFSLLQPDAKVEQKIVEIDGFLIAWEIGWEDNEGNWYKPFQVLSKNELVSTGAVTDIHIQW